MASPTSSRHHHKCFKSSLLLLESLMNDPMRFDPCLWRIRNAIECLTVESSAPETVQEDVKFASSHPEILRASIRFLTFCRTRFEFQRMLDRFPRCRCNLNSESVRNSHRRCVAFLKTARPVAEMPALIHTLSLVPPMQSAKDYFSLLASIVSRQLYVVLLKMTPNKYYNTKQEKSTSSVKKWPQDLTDFLPFGYEHSIQALNTWVTECVQMGHFAFQLSDGLCRFHETFGHHLFEINNHELKYDLAFSTPLQHLRRHIEVFDTTGEPTSISRVPLVSARISASLEAYGSHFDRAIVETCSFLQLIPVFCPAEAPFVFAKNDPTQIFDRLSEILSSKSGKEFDDAKQCFAFFEVLLPRNTEVDWATGKIKVSKSYRKKPANLMLYDEDPESLQYAWQKLTETPRAGCLAPDCPIKGVGDVYIKSCAKCGVVRFCGKDCQRAAWKHSQYPHKEVCAMIFHVRQTIGPEIWPKLFTVEMGTFSDFTIICDSKKVDLDLVKEIGRHLDVLLRMKTMAKARVQAAHVFYE